MLIKSKDLFVLLIAYRILGEKKIKLPLNTKEYWDAIIEIEKTKLDETIEVNFVGDETISLSLFNINTEKSITGQGKSGRKSMNIYLPMAVLHV